MRYSSLACIQPSMQPRDRYLRRQKIVKSQNYVTISVAVLCILHLPTLIIRMWTVRLTATLLDIDTYLRSANREANMSAP